MKVAIGNDHIGLMLRNEIINLLYKKGIDIIDFGTDTKERVYSPVIAEKVSNAIIHGKADYGILICGSGVGMCIAANKVNGIRAVVCSEPYSAEMSKKHNRTNVLCFGSRVVGPELAKMIVEVWLNSEYEGGTRDIRYNMISQIEKHQCENLNAIE